MKENERIDEILISNKPIQRVNISLNKVSKSICKIIYKINNSGSCTGTGFLIKLFKDEKELFCLMTNYHIIKKEMIEKKKNIIIYYNYEDKYIDINLDEKERFIKYNSEMDITIVEI